MVADMVVDKKNGRCRHGVGHDGRHAGRQGGRQGRHGGRHIEVDIDINMEIQFGERVSVSKFFIV